MHGTIEGAPAMMNVRSCDNRGGLALNSCAEHFRQCSYS